VVVASEPLTADRSAWLEAPEYSLMTVEETDGVLRIESRELAL